MDFSQELSSFPSAVHKCIYSAARGLTPPERSLDSVPDAGLRASCASFHAFVTDMLSDMYECADEYALPVSALENFCGGKKINGMKQRYPSKTKNILAQTRNSVGGYVKLLYLLGRLGVPRGERLAVSADDMETIKKGVNTAVSPIPLDVRLKALERTGLTVDGAASEDGGAAPEGGAATEDNGVMPPDGGGTAPEGGGAATEGNGIMPADGGGTAPESGGAFSPDDQALAAGEYVFSSARYPDMFPAMRALAAKADKMSGFDFFAFCTLDFRNIAKKFKPSLDDYFSPITAEQREQAYALHRFAAENNMKPAVNTFWKVDYSYKGAHVMCIGTEGDHERLLEIRIFCTYNWDDPALINDRLAAEPPETQRQALRSVWRCDACSTSHLGRFVTVLGKRQRVCGGGLIGFRWRNPSDADMEIIRRMIMFRRDIIDELPAAGKKSDG